MQVEWRAPNLEDVDDWADALRRIEMFDRTGEVLGRADLEEQIGLSYFDLTHDARLAWTDGEIVAWGTVLCIPSAHQRRVILDGAVVPGWRDRGIGTDLVRWQVDRGREVAGTPEAGIPVWLELSASEADDARRDLFRGFKFAPLRYYHEMRRPLAEGVDPIGLPGGLDLVPFDFALDEATRAAHNEAFRDHFAASELDPETWNLWVTGHHNFRADCSYLVLDGDDIVGYVLNSVHPDDWPALGFSEGWTHQLGVRRPWRGQGVATALLSATAGAFASAELDYAALDVDAENPTGALMLYEAQGYRRSKTRVAWSLPVP
ncbi:MAG: GNAT family N-acetyltransferase [Acidimicrobiia bacterium]